MRITGYRVHTVQQRWGRTIGDANGRLPAAVTPVHVVVVETDAGIEGVGIGASEGLERVFPAIEGRDPRAVSALFDRMLAQVFKSGHAGEIYAAIAAFDSALWDIKAKEAGEPLWRMLGGADRFVHGYASGLDIALSDEELARLYAVFAERGYRAGKLKGGLDVETDLRRLGILTDALRVNASRPGVMLDANESWQVKQAVRYVGAIEEHFDLLWIEEPLRRWDALGHARLSTAVRAAVATGENLTGVEQFRPLFEQGAPDVVQAGAVWGISHLLRLSYAAAARDLPISVVGYNANPAVAAVMTAVPNHLTTEVQTLHFPEGLRVDHVLSDGGIVLSDAPGNGIAVDTIVGDQTGAPERGGWRDRRGPHMRPARAGLRLMLDGDER